MFGGYATNTTTVYLDYDPAADDVIPVFVAPKTCTIVSASAVSANGLAADGTNNYSLALRNIGAAGTATTAVAAAIGGTAGWVALVPRTFTISQTANELAAGDVLAIVYDEGGTGSFTSTQVQIDYVLGVS